MTNVKRFTHLLAQNDSTGDQRIRSQAPPHGCVHQILKSEVSSDGSRFGIRVDPTPSPILGTARAQYAGVLYSLFPATREAQTDNNYHGNTNFGLFNFAKSGCQSEQRLYSGTCSFVLVQLIHCFTWCLSFSNMSVSALHACNRTLLIRTVSPGQSRFFRKRRFNKSFPGQRMPPLWMLTCTPVRVADGDKSACTTCGTPCAAWPPNPGPPRMKIMPYLWKNIHFKLLRYSCKRGV